MRTGLVAVGAAIAIVGASVIVAVALPLNSPDLARISTAEKDGLAPQANWSDEFATVRGAEVSVTFSWVATGPAQVRWYETTPCDGGTSYCIEGGALQSWSDNDSGRWATSGSPSAVYCVEVFVPENASPLNFSADFQESYHASALPLPELPMILTLTGGALLVGIGAIATYLGLFLPAGTYAEPELGPMPEEDDDDGFEDLRGPF
jgi:hypothetical protein